MIKISEIGKTKWGGKKNEHVKQTRNVFRYDECFVARVTTTTSTTIGKNIYLLSLSGSTTKPMQRIMSERNGSVQTFNVSCPGSI